MADLERQLRLYADQVDGVVGGVDLGSPRSARRWVGLAAVAALLVLVGVGLVFLTDEEAAEDLKTEVPETTTTVTPTTSTAAPPSPEREVVEVPSVIGLFFDTADVTLRNVGLVVAPEFRTVPFGDPQVGLVLEQSPQSFSIIEVGSEVGVVVGEAGPLPPPIPEDEVMVVVPLVIGLFYDSAELTLRNQGLMPVVEFRLVPFGDPQIGLVIDQMPGGFESVPDGADVVIVVGEAGEPPE